MAQKGFMEPPGTRDRTIRNKVFLSVCVLLVAAAATWWGLSFRSQHVTVELRGIQYRLGDRDYTEAVTVKVEGTVYPLLKGGRKFKGTIELEGNAIPVPPDQRKVSVELSDRNAGMVSYQWFENGIFRFYHLGGIFADADFTKIAFFLYDQQSDDEGAGGGWTGDNGLMLSAPANNRSDAVAVSRALMKDWLFAPDFDG